MRSVRLNEVLESRLEEAARVSGEPVSNIIRLAIEERCKVILGERLANRLTDVTGIVRSQGGRARRTGKAFLAHIHKGRRKGGK
jgi:hypothetical protein